MCRSEVKIFFSARNMIVDFCNSIWDTRIESDTISSDGFEVCNLISRDVTEKQRGFLGERFVKPVVSILLSFAFPIDVCAINMNPRVGGQKICGVEILSANLRHNCTVQNKNSNIKGATLDVATKSDVFHSYPHVLNVNNIKAEFSSLFNQILRIQLTEGKVGHFVNPCCPVVVNSDFNSRIIGSLSDNVQTCNLLQGSRVLSISHLWIRITRVHKGSVPCLGALEVVGKPAKNNKEFVMNYANLISLRLTQERNKPEESSTEANLSSSSLCKSDPLNEASLVDKTPSEFIDPITLNVMTLPILLPSGNTIDNSTLEKHIAMERNWGRQPCDPFTGVPLGSKVVPNAALKYRIDNFLLSANIKVDELGRTVGSLSDCKSTAKLKFDALLKQDRNNLKGIKRKSHTVHNFKQPPLKKKNEDNSRQLSLKPDSLDQALENVLHVGQKSTPSVKTSSLLPSLSSCQNESQDRQCSGNTSQEGCSHQEEADILFQLPCQHVICRQCLTSAVEIKQCLYCQANFERKDVVRVHSRRTLRIDKI